MNPHLLPSYLSQHLYLHEYIKSQLHCPRVARAWEAIEVRQTTQVRQLQQKALQKQGAGKRAKETQSREQHQCGSDAEVNEKLKEAMHIFVQVRRGVLFETILRRFLDFTQSETKVLVLFPFRVWTELVKIFQENTSSNYQLNQFKISGVQLTFNDKRLIHDHRSYILHISA